MQHSFDIKVAEEYGIAEAILLQNFSFWLAKNKANNQNLHDGRYWTYNSIKAFKELYPYLTENQLRRTLAKLIKEGLVVTGNYNESTYDRTLWYALTDKAMALLGVDLRPGEWAETSQGENHKCNCEKPQMHLAKNTNGFGETHKPIPYINHIDSNTSISTTNIVDSSNKKEINNNSCNSEQKCQSDIDQGFSEFTQLIRPIANTKEAEWLKELIEENGVEAFIGAVRLAARFERRGMRIAGWLQTVLENGDWKRGYEDPDEDSQASCEPVINPWDLFDDDDKDSD